MPSPKPFNFKPFPTLTTDRLRLRRMTNADANFIQSLRSSDIVNKYLDREPQSLHKDILAYIAKTDNGINENQWLYWIIEFKETQQAVGTICLFNFSEDRTTAEVGYEMHPSHFQKGIMSEALQTLITFTFDSLVFDTIKAHTHKDNAGSRALLTKHQFRVDPSTSKGNDVMLTYKLEKSKKQV